MLFLQGATGVFWGGITKLVMPGLVPGIHVLAAQSSKKDVDGRVIGERKRRRPLDGYARP
jgi:hypothetical protein